MTTTDRRFGVNAEMAIKVACRVATTGPITRDGEQTIDGVACVTGDRVLVKDQASGVENGIYLCDTGYWTRSADFDGIRDVTEGTLIAVVQGTVNGPTFWQVTTTGSITPGTTSIAFALRVNALAGVSAYAETLLDDTTAAAARTTLGAAADSAVVHNTGDETVDGTKAFTGANTHAAVEVHNAAERFTAGLKAGASDQMVINNAGVMIAGLVPLARMKRGYYRGASPTASMTVVAGDIIHISALAYRTNTAGISHWSLNINQSAGTAVLKTFSDAYHVSSNTLITQYGHIDFSVAASGVITVTGIVEVTIGGTLTLAVGTGSTGGTGTTTVDGIHAVVLTGN